MDIFLGRLCAGDFVVEFSLLLRHFVGLCFGPECPAPNPVVDCYIYIMLSIHPTTFRCGYWKWSFFRVFKLRIIPFSKWLTSGVVTFFQCDSGDEPDHCGMIQQLTRDVRYLSLGTAFYTFTGRFFRKRSKYVPVLNHHLDGCSL